jgi:N-acetylmuramic acid 6-phosphate (MurNAc-6-P) etherase
LGRDEAIALRERNGGDVKTVIVMQKRGLNASKARKILSIYGGDLRAAIEA